jgi:di/tricarboxylate transporter
MNFDTFITLAMVAAVTAGLVFTRIGPDLLLLGALTALITLGVLTPAEGLAGFANEGMLAIAAFYVISAGLRETGALSSVVDHLFSAGGSVRAAQLRMMLPVMTMSAFVNNTPVVAAFIPAVREWSRKAGFSPSALLMPLSFAAILGGLCTVVGTSTNLVINGLLISETSSDGLEFFELALVGVPCALAGMIYILLTSSRLLPDRIPAVETLTDPREYTVEMAVDENGEMSGRRIGEAGLRSLPGLYLVEIERRGHVLAAVSPDERLEGGDRLVFAGITESVIDLQRMRGLTPAAGQTFKLDAPEYERRFYETVLAASSPVTGKTVRESRFRTRYGAVVIAVARDGRRVSGKIGDIRLMPGDTLLLESGTDFGEQFRRSRDFLLVRPIHDATPVRSNRAPAAWAILAAVVLCASTGLLPLVVAALLGAGAMIATRCLSASAARASIDLQVLIVIAAAFGLGTAMQTSGAGNLVGRAAMAVAGDHPLAVLSAVYVATALLTAIVTNNAAAVLMFPVGLSAATEVGLSPEATAVAIAVAASASFATPVGYQTNLMVYGPGGYKFMDYVRFGLPLTLIVGIIAMLVIPRVW